MDDRVENFEKVRAAFMEHLEWSSKVVSEWPAWKQSVFGDNPVEQQRDGSAKKICSPDNDQQVSQ